MTRVLTASATRWSWGRAAIASANYAQLGSPLSILVVLVTVPRLLMFKLL